MRAMITIAFFLLLALFVSGQPIYTKTFGNSKDQALIFLHGGPGYNCANFEATTAQQLAEKGFFVIVYDRRGEGRSKDDNAKFNFEESFADLNAIYRKYGIKKATLIGHSFGGVVATLFAENNVKKVKSIILVGAPVSMQATFKNIISKSKAIYENRGDKLNLNYVLMLENMDAASLEYSSYCFGHAMQNGFYTPKEATAEAKIIYSTFRTDTLLTKYASKMSYEAPKGFWENEKYTTLDLTKNIVALKKKKIQIFGLYGKDDGLYSEQQIADLENLIGSENLKYFDNCSHNVFIDQQAQFITQVKTWTE